MTDLEKWKEFLAGFGIGFSEEDDGGCKVILIEQGEPKVVGYFGFCVTVSFDGQGKFVELGIYE